MNAEWTPFKTCAPQLYPHFQKAESTPLHMVPSPPSCRKCPWPQWVWNSHPPIPPWAAFWSFFFFGGGRGLELPIVSSVHSLWTSLLEIKGLKPKDSTDLSDVRQLVGDSARLKLKSWIPYQASCRYIGNQMVSEERWPSESCLRSPADVS